MKVTSTRNERRESALVDSQIAITNVELRPQLPVVRAGRERSLVRLPSLSGKPGVKARPTVQRIHRCRELNEDIGPAGPANRAGNGIHRWNDLVSERYLDGCARLHEAVLQIDDEVGRARR